MIIEALILGLCVGVVSVLTGLGGGVILVPLMPSIFGFSQIEAVATSLFVVFLNGSQLFIYARKHKIFDAKTAILLSISGLFTSIFLSYFIYYFPELVLKIFLSLVLLLTIVLMVKPPKIEIKHKSIAKGIIGIGAGSVSAVTGLGGGIVVGPILLSYRLIQTIYLASTISFVSTVFAAAATFTHITKAVANQGFWGPIQWKIGFVIFASAFVMSRILFSYQKSLDDKARKNLLLFFATALFIKSVYSLFY